MQISILGSGTSTGVPFLGCDCSVCTSTDPRNKRLRSCILWSVGDKTLLVDTPPDLRTQLLEHARRQSAPTEARQPPLDLYLDAVLFTHTHADHVHGIDDLRCFNFLQSGPIDCYGESTTLTLIRQRFPYIFDTGPSAGGGRPSLILHKVRPGTVAEVNGIEITPIRIEHGNVPTIGYRIGDVAYLTDCKRIPHKSRRLLKGLDLLILGALRHRPHSTHLSIREAIREVNELDAKRAVLIHMSHQVDHASTDADLPRHIRLAYDGMELKAPDPS